MNILSTKKLPNHYTALFPEIEQENFISFRFETLKTKDNEAIFQSENHYIVTSKNAAKYAIKNGLLGDFYVVGQSTAQLLSSNGCNVINVQHYAGTLLVKLQTMEISFVFLSGNLYSVAFHEVLKKCKRVQVYETLFTPIKTKKNYDAIFFFSPSAIESYLSVQRIPNKTTIFALGKTTASSIERLGNYSIIMPEIPTIEALMVSYIAWKKEQ